MPISRDELDDDDDDDDNDDDDDGGDVDFDKSFLTDTTMITNRLVLG